MGWIDIVWEITKLLVGFGAGVISAVWVMDNEILESFDTGYEIGYSKGSEEEQQKIIENLNTLPTHKDIITSDKHPFTCEEVELISKNKAISIAKRG